MKFQLVEFYPITKKEKKAFKPRSNGNIPIGTLHLYIIDHKIDYRGIRVSVKGAKNKLFFHFPMQLSYDQDTGEPVRYPIMHFVDPQDHKQLLDFLYKDVKPVILKMLKEDKELSWMPVVECQKEDFNG